MSGWWFPVVMLAGRVLSVWLCHAGWRAEEKRGGNFLVWLVLAAWCVAIGGNDWEMFPGSRVWAGVVCALLALEAGGRMGLLAEGKPKILERLLLAGAAAGVWVSPLCVLPCVMISAFLAYTVAGWPLVPGYSNLLGYEFLRASACYLCAGMAAALWLGPGGKWLPLACVCGWQACYYVSHGLAKCALGKHPFAWIAENRVQCLIANSWLRGWGSTRKETMLAIAGFAGKARVAICALAWGAETAWALVFLHPVVLPVLAATMIVFHAVVFLASGLSGLSFIGSHIALAVAWWREGGPDFGKYLLPGFCWMAAYAGFLAWWKPRVIREFFGGGPRPHSLRWLDFADHTMAWWDSPRMRMYRYEVTTGDGRVFHLPVHRLSPYNTFLTDIHTHIMILRRHPRFDPTAEADAREARSGVWGLLTDDAQREMWYARMDGAAKPEKRNIRPEPWTCDSAEETRGALWRCFALHNERCGNPAYRFLMRRPHFPGEDWVPDVPPLVENADALFAFDAPIREARVICVTTFYNGIDVWISSEHVVGCWRIPRVDGETDLRE